MLERLDQQGFARVEVGIEAAVGQAGALHYVGHADAGKAVAAQRARRNVENALMGLFPFGGDGHAVLAGMG